jgi:hypothetical protein
VIVEFALTALVLSLLLATTIDFGRLMFSAQQIQDVARVAARELAVTPLPANTTFRCALQNETVRQRIFDPGFLVLDTLDVEAFLQRDDVPIVNKALVPLMIHDNAGGRNVIRYPGALVEDGSAPSGWTVKIPLVEQPRGTDGVETVTWVDVVEEMCASDPLQQDCANPPASSCPFSLTSSAQQHGLVALRINYPYQAAAMTGFQTAGGPFDPNIANPIQANDGGVTETNSEARPGDLVGAPDEVGPYAGRFGLGRQLAFALPGGVRPFRKLVAAQAIYRREVF